jgi:hypothetical protein
MEAWLFFKAILTLGMLTGLLLAALWAIKKYGTKLPLPFGTLAPDRISIVAARMIDAKHRAIILNVKDGAGLSTEWTILLSPTGPLVLSPTSAREAHHA